MAGRNPKVHDGMCDLVEFEEWIRALEKIFTAVGVPEGKKVNAVMFYLTCEADVWWNTIKDRILRPEFSWSTINLQSRYLVERERIYGPEDE